MSEEKKEKPDWLNDFQNNQATSDKQTCSEGESDQITLDLCGPANTYNSPRYGRRSNTGVKSVENSPKKDPFLENKSFAVRSSSARPALLKHKISPNDLGYEILKDHNAESFTSSLQYLQNDVENFAFNDLFEALGEVCKPNVLNELKPKKILENLEDSWNSLNVFNIKQKGRLGSTTERTLTEEKESKVNKNIERHQLSDKIFEKDSELQNQIKTNSKNAKWKIRTENWGESKDKRENGIVNKNKTDTEEINDFIIPELPQGKTLTFNIKTTWGDKHYLGLNGIEIFNSKGKKVQVKSIKADPPDINILPEYSKDPRVVENLIDNIYLTQDDVHMWLAPFTPNCSHLIIIEFYNMEELAMLRVWNYNKSRIHCCRGAKDVEIKLDNRLIFIGEIARASGEIINTLNFLGDTILFTTDDNILESVSENDEYFIYSSVNHLGVDQTIQEELRPLTGRNNGKKIRPFTCPKQSDMTSTTVSQLTQDKTQESNQSIEEDHLRAMEKSTTDLEKSFHSNKKGEDSSCMESNDSDTSKMKIKVSSDSMKTEKIESNLNWKNDSSGEESDFPDQNYTLYIPSTFLASDSAYETLSMPTGYKFTIQIHSTWGDLYYVGLNGLQIFDENNTKIQIHPKNITADPHSINVLEGIDNDGRTPDKLIDWINDSVDGCHMWLAPVLPLTINKIELTFEDPVTLSALKLWNYAKTPSRGVREFGILVDGLLIYNGELDQAVIPTKGGLPKVPCKTVYFYNSERVQNNKSINKSDKTTSRTLQSVDQSQRPLTTMTSHS